MNYVIIYFAIGLVVLIIQLKTVLFGEHNMTFSEAALGSVLCAVLWPIVLFNFFRQL